MSKFLTAFGVITSLLWCCTVNSQAFPAESQDESVFDVFLFDPPATNERAHVGRRTEWVLNRNDEYAIVVSEQTLATDGWKQVVAALRIFHRDRGVRTHVYKEHPRELWAELQFGGKGEIPRWVALVARPEELNRGMLKDFNGMIRALDDDPWPDAQWGVVTGVDWSSAMRQVVTREPLVIRRGAAGTGLPLECFDEAVWWDEGVAGRSVRKNADGSVEESIADENATMPGIVRSLNDFKPDFFLSSGRATQDDWRVGFTYKGGAFKAEDGALIGVAPDRSEHPVNSPNPKVWLAAGNCLLGDVKDKDSMALAILNAGGATQFLGYNGVTWHGRAGWGTADWFFSDPGRWSIAEAFHLNQIQLISELLAIHPDLKFLDLGNFDSRDDEGFREAFLKKGPAISDEAMFERALGHLWDRDAMVLYGDPAWDARLSDETGLPWSATVSYTRDTSVGGPPIRHETWRIRFEAKEAVELSRPLAAILPYRLLVGEVLETGGSTSAIVSDDFVMLPDVTSLEAGEVREVVIRGCNSDPRDPVLTIERSWAEAEAQIDRLPFPYRDAVRRQLEAAESNFGELVGAIEWCSKEEELQCIGFLLAYMPERDLLELECDFLVEHVRGALRVRADSRFCRHLPEEIFLNEVLPYALVGERRELWRAPLQEKYLALVEAASDQEAAVKILNKRIWGDFGIKYHATKRPKTDQSPSETVNCGIASCTGLSIILADACRAVGIPARLAGVPMWHNDTGNHTWIEVWEDGEWHFVEALSSDGYDQAWWTQHADKADASRPRYAVWATSYKPSGEHFPLEWDPKDESIPAVNVTDRYVGGDGSSR